MATTSNLTLEAEKQEKQGRLAEAAALWERLGELDRAVACLRRGGHGARAAQLLAERGRHKDAAQHYIAVGKYLEAAACLERIDQPGEAARCFLRAGARDQAAMAYERAEAWADAAKVYASLGNFARAVALFERAGDHAQARALDAQHGVARAQAAAAQQARRAEFEALLDGTAFVDEQRFVDGVLFFLAEDRLADAARLYSHSREDIGFTLITRVSGNREAELRLAKMLAAAKDHHKAAQVLEGLGAHAQAARLYEHADDFERAAEMYAKAAEPAKAAEMFERAGRFAEAADLFLQAGARERAAENYARGHHNLVAGKLFLEVGKRTRSLQTLQKVQRTEPGYREAARLVADLLAGGGYRELALRKLGEAIAGEAVGAENAELFYRAAELCAELGQRAEAEGLFGQLLTWDIGYRDARERLAALRGAAGAAGPTATAPTSAPAGGEGAGVVSLMDGFDFLRETRLFGELSLEETKAVYHAAERRSFAPGEVLIEQDQPGPGLWVIRRGTVAVRRRGASGESALAELGPGAPVGEMSLFDAAPTSARVVATSDGEAFALPREAFLHLLAANDRMALRVYRALVQTLSERLRASSAKA